jgi:hypothetical protein
MTYDPVSHYFRAWLNSIPEHAHSYEKCWHVWNRPGLIQTVRSRKTPYYESQFMLCFLDSEYHPDDIYPDFPVLLSVCDDFGTLVRIHHDN